MNASPFNVETAFMLGPLAVTWPVVVTWGIMAVLTAASFLMTRRLTLKPGRAQAVLELIVSTLDSEIRATVEGDPARFRPLIGTLLIFILAANWTSLVPGVEPPTAHLETDAALAAIVFFASIYWGIRSQGIGGWLASFVRPSWLMLPLNVIGQVTRHFSLMIRLFGNVMSGVFVISIVLSLAGLLVPIPLMALEMLTGAVQAYIFATLALVFVGSAVSEAGADKTKTAEGADHMTEYVEIASIICATLAVCLGAVAPALAEGRAVAAALEAIARQPESAGTISRTLFVGLAMIETTAIYCLVVSLLLLFANPFTQ
jgi:F-type H+-transporting ATPase subunit a